MHGIIQWKADTIKVNRRVVPSESNDIVACVLHKHRSQRLGNSTVCFNALNMRIECSVGSQNENWHDYLQAALEFLIFETKQSWQPLSVKLEKVS
jgi:hypothetical protein